MCKDKTRKELLTPMGAELLWTGMRSWGGGNDAKFGEKRMFWKLEVGDKKGEEAKGREIRGRGEGLAMDIDFYLRNFL